jgi:hypothetical protein
MTQREKRMLRGVLLVGGGIAAVFFGYQLLLAPLLAYDRQINALQSEIETKRAEVARIRKELQQVERWRLLSLPADPELDTKYIGYLWDLADRSGLEKVSIRPNPRPADAGRNGPPGSAPKKPVYTPLSFTITGQGRLKDVQKLLRSFQATPLDQKIRNLTLEVASGQKVEDRLNVTLVVEAITLDKADKVQPNLIGPDERLAELSLLIGLRGGTGALAMVPWALGPRGPFGRPQLALGGPTPGRKYELLHERNIFTGLKPPAKAIKPSTEYEDRIAELIFLNSISGDSRDRRAYLTDWYHNHKTLTLAPDKTFTLYDVKDATGKRRTASGRVLRIDSDQVYFESDGKVYEMRLGASLAEAMRTPLAEAKARALRVVHRSGS